MDIAFGIIFSFCIAAAFLWAVSNTTRRPVMPPVETIPDLIARLELEPDITTLEVRVDQSVQVVDAKGSSYGLEIGPATVIIIKRHEPVEPVSELIGA